MSTKPSQLHKLDEMVFSCSLFQSVACSFRSETNFAIATARLQRTSESWNWVKSSFSTEAWEVTVGTLSPGGPIVQHGPGPGLYYVTVFIRAQHVQQMRVYADAPSAQVAAVIWSEVDQESIDMELTKSEFEAIQARFEDDMASKERNVLIFPLYIEDFEAYFDADFVPAIDI